MYFMSCLNTKALLQQKNCHLENAFTLLDFFLRRVFLGLVCLVAICSARPADDDYAEYEDDAPAPPPKPARNNPLIGRRNPLQRGGATKASSTTPAPPPAEV